MSQYASAITRPPKTLTEREVALLLRATGQHKDGFRDHVLISLALATGLREHELLALDVGDLTDDAGRVRRHVRLRVFKRSSDETAHQEIVLSDTVRAKLEKMLRGRRDEDADVGPTSPVFISRLGRRLSSRQLRRAFREWQKRAGLDRCFHFHAIRHTACTTVYRNTRDLRLTQRFARHRSVLSTAIYTHPSDDELLRAVQAIPC
jgi:integrase